MVRYRLQLCPLAARGQAREAQLVALGKETQHYARKCACSISGAATTALRSSRLPGLICLRSNTHVALHNRQFTVEQNKFKTCLQPVSPMPTEMPFIVGPQFCSCIYIAQRFGTTCHSRMCCRKGRLQRQPWLLCPALSQIAMRARACCLYCQALDCC